MPPEAPCPHVEELRSLMLGTVLEARAAYLEEHLARCEHCGRAVDTLVAEDALVATMRALPRLPPPADCDRIGGLIAGLEKQAALLALDTAAREDHDASAGSAADALLPGASDEPPLPGQIGRYRVLGRLGAGGMGAVYKAHDPQLLRTVAIKVPRFKGSPETQALARQRFLREARAAAAIRHPHVCPIYDVGEQGGVPYVVMACVEGASLAASLGSRQTLDCRQAVDLARQIAEALDVVHAHGIVHRDLKPGNVLLDGAGQAVLTDFGLARPQHDDERLTSEGALLGTPSYMSPEQASSVGGSVGPPSDLYSLGVMLYQMVTGRLPFEGPVLSVLYQVAHAEAPPPSQLRPDLDPALEAIIRKAMARRPEERYGSARELADVLKAWQAGAAPETQERPAPAAPRSRPGRAASQPASTAVLPPPRPKAAVAAPPGRQAAPAAARPPRRRRLVLAALAVALGLAGISVVAGQIIVRVRDRDGRQTEVPVPPGGAAEVVQDGKVVGRFQAGDGGAAKPGLPAGPLDRLRREDIPAAERFPWQPEELVAVFGTHAWRDWFHAHPLEIDDTSPNEVALAFSEDGKRVIAIDRGGARSDNSADLSVGNGDTARAWDAASGKEVRRFALRKACRMIYLPATRTLALLDGDRSAWTLKLWNIDTGQEQAEVVGDNIMPHYFALSPNGKALVTEHWNGVLRLWDPTTGKELAPFPAPEKMVGFEAGATFSADGKLLAAAYSAADGKSNWADLKVYDVASRKEVGGAHADGMRFWAPVFTPDAKAVLLGQCDAQGNYAARLWDVASKDWRTPKFPGPVFALSPDGARVAVRAGVFDTATGERITGFDGPPVTHALAFSPDGKRLAGTNSLGDIVVYDAASGKPLTPRPDPFTFLAVSGDGAIMAVPETRYPQIETYYQARGAGALRLVETATGKVRCRIRVPEAQGIESAALSPGGKLLATVSGNSLQLYDAATGDRMQTLGELRAASTVAFSANGKWLVCRVAGGADQQLKVWDTATWQEKGAVPAPDLAGFFVTVPAVSPDGRRVASLCGSPGKLSLTLFDLAAGRECLSLPRQPRGVLYALSPDWERVACDGKLFDVATGKEVAALKGAGTGTQPLTDLVFAPDGKSLYCSGEEGRLVRWSAPDGSILKEWRLGGRIQRQALTADGRYLFVSNQNGTVYVLRLAAGA